MESPGSDISTDSTDSSSADSTSADSTPAQAISSMSENQNPSTMDKTTIIDNDDSESDISMSADSDDEEGEDMDVVPPQVTDGLQAPETTPFQSPDTTGKTSKKRKFSDAEDTAHGIDQHEVGFEVRKRLKPDTALQRHWTAEGSLQEDRSLLPAEIWHHIFTFCPPRVLGILLQVNKSFNAYLDPSSLGSSHEPLSISATKVLAPMSIWRASRSLYNLPTLPNPLLGKSELDMWKLACSTKCQFCGKKRQPNSAPVDPWHPGPGENGVSPIWSFEIRACGPCLQKQSMKEIDLLLSSSIPSPLLAALPFIFLTNELHAIPSSTLQSGQQQPTGIQVTKHYFTSQIEAIKAKFEEVKALGSATAEEWLKGLDGQGQEKKNDAARWERWELQGGVTRMRNLEAIEAASRLLRTATARSAFTSSTTNSNLPMLQTNGSLPKPPHLPNNSMHPLPMPVHSIIANAGPPRFGSPVQNGFASYTPRQPQVPKHERTKDEVAKLKLARKEEIERRCMLLNPPITAAVLAHMPSFQAAIQIIQPVTDSAWEVLEPRLLSQREEAEQRENDRLAQTRVVQEQERRFQDTQARSDSKDLVDREWDDIQAPLRARIGGYADEIIRDGWNGGGKVSYETSPHFAAEVLMYVRKRFYAETAKDDAAIRATGREPEADPPNGPYTRKLILENMKWVFDTKVKPYTEVHRKELFLCNACEYASKYYGFEGVIQHFAAKHTNALSSGSVVVHWKSEWPEYPPFNPEPSSMTPKPYYSAVPNASVPYSGPPPMQQAYGYGGYQPAPVSAPPQASNPHGYQENSGPYYGNPQYGDQYSAPQNGSYAPPSVYQDPSTGYQAPQYSVPPPLSVNSGYNDVSQGYPQQNYSSQYPSTTHGMYTSPHDTSQYPTTSEEMSVQQQPYLPPTSEYGSSYNQTASYTPASYTQPPQKTEEYSAQLQELAKNARQLWSSIGNLKEVPGALKVYTIIYHILQRFRATFQEDPPLSMLVDGLSNNKDMRPVRNVNGLLCKACSLGMVGSTSAQKKHFSFPQLVSHFHSVHEQGLPHNTMVHTPDWTRDMVDLPDMSKLTSVVNAPAMDDQKLKLFTDALPELVSVPETQAEESRNSFNGYYEDRAEPSSYPELAPSQDNHDKYYATVERGRPSIPGSAQPDSGEYDPHNPGNVSLSQPPVYKAPRKSRPTGERAFIKEEEPVQRYHRYEDEPRREVYDHTERPYGERRPSSSYGIPVAEYERVVVRDEAPIYLDRQPRYRNPDEVEYRVRREPQALRYEEPEMVHPAREYRVTNSQSFQSNRELPLLDERGGPSREAAARPAEDATAQQNRIIDVVAQISQHAQQARERQPIREEQVETGSEDGEVRPENGSHPAASRTKPIDEASTEAERFLDNFQPGEGIMGAPKAIHEPERRPTWEADRNESTRAYQPSAEAQRRPREYDEDERFISSSRRVVNPAVEDEYVIHERASAPRQPRTYAYDDRYMDSMPEPVVRDRSPELVDRRYKLNNVVYRDERQGSSNSTHRTPSRYARYESARLENDRARSRSPVYVKMGPQPGEYRERSPEAPPLRQEPVYRARTPHQAHSGEEIAYERPPPRQEYYRVYADEPRPRAPPQYAEPAYEYVRVADPQGDYMIRRPVRREPEPVYYEDEIYSRQPVYESRALMARAERAEPQYEEYDPRQPVPGSGPAPAPVRQARYQ